MNRGDVVELNWPCRDLSGSKLRPAVVVQADFLNGLIDDTVLVQVTSTQHGIPGTEVLIDPARETASGLSRVCVASCANVLTFDQSLLRPNVKAGERPRSPTAAYGSSSATFKHASICFITPAERSPRAFPTRAC